MRRTSRRSSPPAPTRAALAALGPYARTQLTVLQLRLDVPFDVFATHAVDAGTLLPGGELRAVVIRDLRDQVEGAQVAGLRLVARGGNHLVYSVPPGPTRFSLADESVYARDQTRFEAALGRVLLLSRPHDASEDPAHAAALSALLDAAPRDPPRSVLCFRCGYGALPLAARVRWPQARVVAQDRDLLDTAF